MYLYSFKKSALNAMQAQIAINADGHLNMYLHNISERKRKLSENVDPLQILVIWTPDTRGLLIISVK